MLQRGTRWGAVVAAVMALGMVAAGPAEAANPLAKPDLLIRKAGKTYVGDNIYVTEEGAGQIASAKVRRRESVTFDIQVQNDAALAIFGGLIDTVTLTGSPAFPGFKVTYFDGATDITDAMLAGTYQTPSLWLLKPNHTIQAVVKVKKSAFFPQTLLIGAYSQRLGIEVDLVQAKVTPK